jgi:hypothetical protein
MVNHYLEFEELTTYMINEFVSKIIVHERARKGSIETTQQIDIYFNFIGQFVPPHFYDVDLTQEEIAELKKREARKDRLHHNYLKRKANGKQAEYYEKTKAKKKAELESRKLALKVDDMKKGVFSYVADVRESPIVTEKIAKV